MRQADIPALRAAINSTLQGGDPLDFVNAFFRCPVGAPAFPKEYWERRICAVAEMLAEAGKQT